MNVKNYIIVCHIKPQQYIINLPLILWPLQTCLFDNPSFKRQKVFAGRFYTVILRKV